MRIGDICQVRAGYAFRGRIVHESDGCVVVIQPKDISSDGLISFANCEPLRADVPGSRPLQPGDVLVLNRGRFAAAVFHPSEAEPYIVPSSILILTVTTKSVLPEFVALYLNSSSGRRLLRRHLEKTTIPFISAGNLADMDIPIPPLARQRALVGFETVAKQYARQTLRKRELLKRLLDGELTKSKQPANGRTR